MPNSISPVKIPARIMWSVIWGPLALALLALAALVIYQRQAVTITLDPSRQFQTFRAWEATVETPPGLIPKPYRDKVYESLIRDVGITRLRLEVYAGDEGKNGLALRDYYSGKTDIKGWRRWRYTTINDDTNPFHINPAGFDFFDLDTRMELGVLPLIKMAKAQGKTLELLLTYVAFTEQNKGACYLHTQPEEYAEFVLATFLHLKEKYGITPGSFEPLLEPDLAGRWTPEGFGKAVGAAVTRLHENGFHPRIVTPSVSNIFRADDWLEGIAKTVVAEQAISEISYHRYYGGPERVLTDLAQRASRIGAETSMLEYWFGKATHDLLYEDITVANVSAWQGRSDYTYHTIETDGSFTLAPDTRLNRLYMQAIRPGAIRIAADGGRRNRVRATAFLTTEGQINLILDSLKGGTANIVNLPPGPYLLDEAYVSLPDRPQSKIVVPNSGKVILSLPEEGVLTLRAAP